MLTLILGRISIPPPKLHFHALTAYSNSIRKFPHVPVNAKIQVLSSTVKLQDSIKRCIKTGTECISTTKKLCICQNPVTLQLPQ